MSTAPPSRDELASRYLDQLPYTPYPIQEEALLAWFSAEQGVLVCTPTGTGKTLIAEAALFEALHTGKTAYYTTPLIALTEQKFREMQAAAVRWGFHPDDVGLVTGNRRENPDARVLVVVAEILLNRLLHEAAFDFTRLAAVVMDEFHSFTDPERGIVWELSLGLLPPEVRVLLLSATVGNAMEFVHWLRTSHQRQIELVKGEDRKVPLEFHWVPDMLLAEHLEEMAHGDADARRTPALVFCFNREECWSVGEQIKGRKVLSEGQQARLGEELARHDWSQGAGPKLRQLLLRGVGVHHAGLLPKYRRIVEDLFQHKLLSVVMCTETLSAGINLPARSVVLPSIMKGPQEKKRLLEASAAHQIFGRAGRPQFDARGYVYVLAHEDDVRIARWREKFEQIPADTKDPGLLKARKALERKRPKRRDSEQYWNEAQFQKLVAAPAGKLHSRGPLPWRLLAYMLDASPEVERIRRLVAKRLMDAKHLELGQRELDRLLLVLHRGGYVRLEPEPPPPGASAAPAGENAGGATAAAPERKVLDARIFTPGSNVGWVGRSEPHQPGRPSSFTRVPGGAAPSGLDPPYGPLDARLSTPKPEVPAYRPVLAQPTPELAKLALFRGINPLYAVFLIGQLGIADRAERLQAFESVLEMPRSLGRFVRVPKQDRLPPGPLATTRLDAQLLQLGLATAEELVMQPPEETNRPRHTYDEDRVWVLALGDKLRRLFDYELPGVHDLRTQPVWAAGELLEFGGNFNNYVTSRDLAKQEGVIFRHLLRLILLLGELRQLCPPELEPAAWEAELDDIAGRLTESCHQVDPTSTDRALEQVEQATAETAEAAEAEAEAAE